MATVEKPKVEEEAPPENGAKKGTALDTTHWDKRKYNVLVPSERVKMISPYHIISVREVRIDPDPSEGMVYKLPASNKLALGRVALDNLAQAAGIIWHPSETKCVLSESRRCEYAAIGGLRKPDGTFAWVKACKEINMDVIEREIRFQYKRKVEAKELTEEKAEVQIERDVIAYWKHMHARCDTGARLRVIRSLLGLKSGYSAEELKKPFVVPAIQFSPWDDPDMAQKAKLAFLYDREMDYGDFRPPKAIEGVPTEECKAAHEEVEDAKQLPKPEWEEGETVEEPAVALDGVEELTPEDIEEIQAQAEEASSDGK